jgi:hypothetical protein
MSSSTGILAHHQGRECNMKMSKGVTGFCISGIVALSAVCSAAHADTLVGTNFDVVYNPAAVGLFGLPSISGNTVFFTPNNFKAESLGGAGIVTTNQTVVIDIVPHAGFDVTGTSLLERGDYLLRNATSLVDLQGQTRGFAIANPLVEVNDNIDITSGPLTTLNASTNWTAASFLDLSALQADNRGYRITIENLLTAYTDSSASGLRQAFIEKKFAGETIGLEVIGVTPVPEPQTYAMFLAGFGLLGFMARRRKQTSQ